MELKQYQETAVKELLTKSQKLLGYTESKKLVFKAPTGLDIASEETLP